MRLVSRLEERRVSSRRIPTRQVEVRASNRHRCDVGSRGGGRLGAVASALSGGGVHAGGRDTDRVAAVRDALGDGSVGEVAGTRFGLGRTVEIAHEPRQVLGRGGRPDREAEFAVHRVEGSTVFRLRRLRDRAHLGDRPRDAGGSTADVHTRRRESLDRAATKQPGVLCGVEQRTGGLAEGRRQLQCTDEPTDLRVRVHAIPVAFGGYLCTVVLGSHTSQPATFATGDTGRATDLRREAAVVTRARERRARPFRIRLVVVERPPLGAVVDPVGFDDEPALGTHPFPARRLDATGTLGTAVGVLWRGSRRGDGGPSRPRTTQAGGRLSAGRTGSRRLIRSRSVVDQVGCGRVGGSRVGCGRVSGGRAGADRRCLAHHT